MMHRFSGDQVSTRGRHKADLTAKRDLGKGAMRNEGCGGGADCKVMDVIRSFSLC